MGSPKATQAGVGARRGDFQRYRFPEKENTEPQNPSIAAGMTGTLAVRAMSSNPRRIVISWPVRDISPSGKMHTSSPRFRAATASLSHWTRQVSDTGMTPARPKNPAHERSRPGPA